MGNSTNTQRLGPVRSPLHRFHQMNTMYLKLPRDKSHYNLSSLIQMETQPNSNHHCDQRLILLKFHKPNLKHIEDIIYRLWNHYNFQNGDRPNLEQNQSVFQPVEVQRHQNKPQHYLSHRQPTRNLNHHPLRTDHMENHSLLSLHFLL